MDKATVFNIKRYAIHDGPGIRQTIFFKGCPLDCWWCHNPESKKVKPEKVLRKCPLNSTEPLYEEEIFGKEFTSAEIMQQIEKEVIFFDESDGGVTFSGGEPLLHHEFLLQLLKRCREQEIHTAVDTTGYAAPDLFAAIMQHTDLFLYDLKHMDDILHQKFTGVSNKLILANLRSLAAAHKRVIIRIPVIPGINDGKENISQSIDFLSSLINIREIDLLPYHDIARGKYKRFQEQDRMKDTQVPSDEQMMKLKTIFEKAGFVCKIGG